LALYSLRLEHMLALPALLLLLLLLLPLLLSLLLSLLLPLLLPAGIFVVPSTTIPSATPTEQTSALLIVPAHSSYTWVRRNGPKGSNRPNTRQKIQRI
jgi:hypothetical protein